MTFRIRMRYEEKPEELLVPWEFKVPLEKGKNTITAVALKGAARASRSFMVTFTPPLVVYLDAEPEFGVDYTKNLLTLTGRVNQPEASVTVNDKVVTVTPDGGFTAQALLVEGSNSINAVATLGDERDEVYILYMVENGRPSPVPGYSHFFSGRDSHKSEITIKAGDTGTIDVIYETRKSGSGEYSGKVFYVSGEYSEEGITQLYIPCRSFHSAPNNAFVVATMTCSGSMTVEIALRQQFHPSFGNSSSAFSRLLG